MTERRTDRRRGRRRKRILCVTALLLLLAGSLLSPLSHYPVSLAVMRVYSHMHWEDSVMAQRGIDLEIPGGAATEEKDWYPFVMAFNASAGFRAYAGEAQADLTVLYNFPAFDVGKGCSRLYDPASPYYNGFYGAYLISGASHPYGFRADGTPDLAEIAGVPQYDLQQLVLADLGLPRSARVFDWQAEAVTGPVSYAGSDGWTRVDATLTVNGTWHVRQRFCRSYLQYGSPRYDSGSEPFAPVQMAGRLYGKYFPQWDTSVFFYVLARDPAVVEDCDAQILSESTMTAQ